MLCPGRVACGLRRSALTSDRVDHARLTYLPKIFLRDGSSVDHWNTLTFCSELRGIGSGKLMISLKKELVSSFNFETVTGMNPSRF